MSNKIELFGYECGVLLSKDEAEYAAYSSNNPNLPYGFYDENQEYFSEDQLSQMRQTARQCVEEGVDRTYAIISLQGMFDQETAKDLCAEMHEPLDYSYFKKAKDVVYSVCKIDGVIHEGFLEAAIRQTNLDIVAKANALVQEHFSGPDQVELFGLTEALYQLKDVSKNLAPNERLLLARKTLDASMDSPTPLLLAERIDAVRCLLENGVPESRSLDFPKATPDQMQKLLLTCDLDVFTEIVDTVAVDNQSFYAPDNQYSIIASEIHEKAITVILECQDKSIDTTPSKTVIDVTKMPVIFKEIADDLVNEMSNVLRDGFYPTFEDACAELHLPDSFAPQYTLVAWGEENDKEEKFFSVAVYKNDSERKPNEQILSLFTESDSLEALRISVFQVLNQFEEKMIQQLFIFDEELFVNDDLESVNGYLWAVDGLVDRLPASQEMENINFYAEYNAKIGDINLTATFDTSVADGELNKSQEVPLTEREKELLVKAMNQYCAEKEGVSSCLELINIVREEERRAPLTNLSAKSSLSDVIRAASLKVEPTPTNSPKEDSRSNPR